MGLILDAFLNWKPTHNVNFSKFRMPVVNKTTGVPKAYDNDIRKILSESPSMTGRGARLRSDPEVAQQTEAKMIWASSSEPSGEKESELPAKSTLPASSYVTESFLKKSNSTPYDSSKSKKS